MKSVLQYMSKDLPLIKEELPLKEIITIFSNSHHSILPVVNARNRLIGHINIEDIVYFFLFSHMDITFLEKMPSLIDFFSDTIENVDNISPIVFAKDVMRTNVFTIKETDSIIKAAIRMKKRNVHRLIVVDIHQTPVGFISRNEICKALLI